MKAYSPILGSRVAVSTSAGLSKALEEIRLAIDVSKRQRELTALDIAAQRVQSLTQTVGEHQRSEQLLRSYDGANLVKDSVETVWEKMQKVLCEDADPSAPVKFQCRRPVQNSMYVSTEYGMDLRLHLANFCVNYVVDTRLEIKIFRRQWDNFEQPLSDLMMRFEMQFQPTFRSGDEVVWLNPDKSATLTTEGLAAYLIELFADYVQKEIKGGER